VLITGNQAIEQTIIDSEMTVLSDVCSLASPQIGWDHPPSQTQTPGILNFRLAGEADLSSSGEEESREEQEKRKGMIL
jgi:hypothetical protein